MKRAPILMNGFRSQWTFIREEVLAAVDEVGSSGWYILGEHVRALECAVAAYTGRKYCVGCANGMDAIEMGLRALGLRAGERVLTTPLSAFATSLAIIRAGGVPTFVDVDASGLVDMGLVEEQLGSDRSLRFFVPVHLYGKALELDRLEALKREFDLKIVEDMCQAIGAKSGTRQVGSVGQVGAISFYPTKNLGALGDGGALVTDDPAIDALCRSLRDYGQSAKYRHEVQGLNSRLDELHAAILSRALLPRLPAWTSRRREIAKAYLDGIRHSAVLPLQEPAGSDPVWHLFPITVPVGLRDALGAHLSDNGIQTGVHYPILISAQEALRDSAAAPLGRLDRAQSLSFSELSIPIHPFLTDGEVERVIEATNAWAAS